MCVCVCVCVDLKEGLRESNFCWKCCRVLEHCKRTTFAVRLSVDRWYAECNTAVCGRSNLPEGRVDFE